MNYEAKLKSLRELKENRSLLEMMFKAARRAHDRIKAEVLLSKIDRLNEAITHIEREPVNS